jgi:hypothetical protein
MATTPTPKPTPKKKTLAQLFKGADLATKTRIRSGAKWGHASTSELSRIMQRNALAVSQGFIAQPRGWKNLTAASIKALSAKPWNKMSDAEKLSYRGQSKEFLPRALMTPAEKKFFTGKGLLRAQKHPGEFWQANVFSPPGPGSSGSRPQGRGTGRTASGGFGPWHGTGRGSSGPRVTGSRPQGMTSSAGVPSSSGSVPQGMTAGPPMPQRSLRAAHLNNAAVLLNAGHHTAALGAIHAAAQTESQHVPAPRLGAPRSQRRTSSLASRVSGGWY